MVNVLVIGDAILDHYVYGVVSRQSPEDANIPVLDQESEDYRLGGCLNVAANIKSLAYPKVTVYLASVFSPFTGKILEQKGILCDDSCLVDDRRSGTVMPSSRELIKTRYINSDTQKQLLRRDNRKKYLQDDIDRYRCSLGNLDRYDAIVISDYCKGLVNGWTLRKLQDFDGPVFIDTKKKDLSIWKDLDKAIIKINDKEFAKSSGAETLKNLIVTTGAKGCTHYTEAGEVHYPTEPVEDPEVTGAGDVYLAGLVSKFLLEGDIEEAIKFANKVARISVTKKGTTEVRL
jgi:D-beta-D-heptose 7-phosphate kinase/D-beta-D-heptose 1-phosphate adenosyltransferase